MDEPRRDGAKLPLACLQNAPHSNERQAAAEVGQKGCTRLYRKRASAVHICIHAYCASGNSAATTASEASEKDKLMNIPERVQPASVLLTPWG